MNKEKEQKLHDLQVRAYQIDDLIKQLSRLSDSTWSEITRLINK